VRATSRDTPALVFASHGDRVSPAMMFGGMAEEPSADGGITPGKLLEFYYVIWLVHFDAIWWQYLFVGRRTRYICNFAMKIELICQLQCPRDCTVVLLLLSNEHALTQLQIRGH